ncbi:hypothetical protein BC829DRAFT_448094 [Chytridium lagenaria]|nr:hypothetical protein BC829DRAFT_448094 [Chytridium lagenaria]
MALSMLVLLAVVLTQGVDAWGRFGHSVTGHMAQKRQVGLTLGMVHGIPFFVIRSAKTACTGVPLLPKQLHGITSTSTPQLPRVADIKPVTVQIAVGGNDAALTYNGVTTNFHAIHDTQIPVQRSLEVNASSPVAYADFLISRYASQREAFTAIVDLVTMDENDMLRAPVLMSDDANQLDCSETGFWRYYDSVKIPIEIQMAKAGFRIAKWIDVVAKTCAECAGTVIRRDAYCGDVAWDPTCVRNVGESCEDVKC